MGPEEGTDQGTRAVSGGMAPSGGEPRERMLGGGVCVLLPACRWRVGSVNLCDVLASPTVCVRVCACAFIHGEPWVWGRRGSLGLGCPGPPRLSWKDR